ncbi:MAG TPA: DUF1595 domain-containing protein, partial [Polyangiaceae bacterium]|nr:DUF1595 domain-containing protein [Polyangiaceae bacterium]
MKTANELGVLRRSRVLLVSCAASSVLAFAACTGTIGSGSPGGNTGPGTPGGGQPGGSGMPSAVMHPPPMAVDPGAVPGMHRLNALEYDNTINDLFGVTQNLARTSFQADEKGTFDNQADAFTMSDTEFTQYFNAAQALGDQVFADPKLVGNILSGCADNSCLQSVITSFGLRAYRRPLTPDEITRAMNLAAYAVTQGADFPTSVSQVVKMMLSSIPFLYRVELDPNPTDTQPHAVGDYEMASRLSYLVWSSMPDAALFADAAAGKLASSDTTALVGHVDRMLADPRA